MSRLRPRFSVRTLAIFMTLVCCYFGALEAAKKYGCNVPMQVEIDGELLTLVHTHFNFEHSPAPLVVYQDGHFEDGTYYLWLFGPKIKLPFESTWE